MNKLRVIDFFCGAGGFSEGFRQMGFEILYGFDSWKPAVDTFNYNFKLQCKAKNILDFKNSIDEIEKLPNSEVIIGSPPCVSFSSSNKSGNADKSLGVELTETFLRIVAIKKHQPNSNLKAWFMENVVNSKRYLQTAYTFKDLGLADWALKYRISPLKIAINLYENSTIINSADYGAFQRRKRIISGEIIKYQKLVIPEKTHSDESISHLKPYNNIEQIKSKFPSPFDYIEGRLVDDVQYNITINGSLLTDHFYDTGVYKTEWEMSKFYKTNHPFMGKMSFPENESKPSRTITATSIANSRESILYKSELNRIGDGEYRLPTVREAAIIMGFPISFQFLGLESSKWRLVGNAVCCSVSRAFAKVVLDAYKINTPTNLTFSKYPNLEGVLNLNTYSLRNFDNQPVKNKNARFRRHAIKDGNITVTLSNYDIEINTKIDNKWFTSIQYGNGKGFPIQKIEDNFFMKIEEYIQEKHSGKNFLAIINNGFTDKIGKSEVLQELYEAQHSTDEYKNPSELVNEIETILEKIVVDKDIFIQNENKIFKFKNEVPVSQLYALYAINKISSIANSK